MARSVSLLPPIEKEYVWEGRRRFYQIGDQVRPGVTTVLGATADKTWIRSWEERIGQDEAERVRQHAATRGTQLHKRLENELVCAPAQLSLLDEAETDRLGMTGEVDQLWISASYVLPRIDHVRLIEGNVFWDDKQRRSDFGTGYAGCIDCVAELDGELRVIDWKTSRHIRKKREWMTDYFVQAAAYRQALKQRYADTVDWSTLSGAAVILFNTEGEPPQIELLDNEELDMCWLGFQSRLRRFHANHRS